MLNSNTVALSSGKNGISQSVVISTPQPVGLIHVQRFESPRYLQHQSKTNGNFCRGDRQYQQEDNLTVWLPPPGTGGNKCQRSGVEHHFQGHQHKNDIAPQHETHESTAEQTGGK
jgi:hypothetical protein